MSYESFGEFDQEMVSVVGAARAVLLLFDDLPSDLVMGVDHREVDGGDNRLSRRLNQRDDAVCERMNRFYGTAFISDSIP